MPLAHSSRQIALALVALLGAAPVCAAEPAGTAPQPTRAFRDWALSCSAEPPCLLSQRIFVGGDSTSPLLQIGFQISQPSGPLLGIIRVPLGVRLTAGIQLLIDGADTEQIAFHHCRQDGCLAIFSPNAALESRLRRGREARIAFELLDGQRVSIPVSLLGITAGLEALHDAAGG